jgi:3-oxoacyl-[acyl-carrier protein] reductase
MDLKGKRAVVTGASRGLGMIIAKALVENGTSVLMVSRNEERLKKSFEELSSETGRKELLSYKSVDVSDYSKVQNAFSGLGKIDVLVNCAGILGPVGPLEENPIEDWKKTIEVNLIGTVNCCKAAIPLLKKNSRGKIINFGGGGSAYARKYHSAYGCSKCAVVRFTETIAMEFENIDVNVIAPGAHNTDMWKEETYAKPPEKWSDPNKMVELILFLSSSESDGITGKFIHILDDYKDWKPGISSKEDYTLRRVE